MSTEYSRTVRLALSYIDDAEAHLDRANQDDNEFGFDKEADAILGGEVLKASVALKKAADNSEDVTEANVRLLVFHAQLAFEATKKWDGRRINEQYAHIWTKWADRFLAAQTQLVNIDPSPQNQYNLGLALYASDRFDEAIEALLIAEGGTDDDISIESTKLIEKISAKTTHVQRKDHSGDNYEPKSDIEVNRPATNQITISASQTRKQVLPFTILDGISIISVVVSFLRRELLGTHDALYWILTVTLIGSLIYALTVCKSSLVNNYFRTFVILIGAILVVFISPLHTGYGLPMFGQRLIQLSPLLIPCMHVIWMARTKQSDI